MLLRDISLGTTPKLIVGDLESTVIKMQGGGAGAEQGSEER